MRHPSQLSERDQAVTLLRGFFERESAGTADAIASHCRRVQQQLASFLAHGDMSSSLGLHENAVLAAARRNGRGFFDVFGLEELVACLPQFVAHDWLLEDAACARTQVVLVGRLVAWLDAGGHLDHELLGGALQEAQRAVQAAEVLVQIDSKPSPTPHTVPPRPMLTLIRGGRANR